MDVKKIDKRRENAFVSKSIDMMQFYLIEPAEGGDASKVAKDLIEISGVKEVYVVEGEYGFLVKTKSEEKSIALQRFLDKKFSNRYEIMTTHYNCKKR